MSFNKLKKVLIISVLFIVFLEIGMRITGLLYLRIFRKHKDAKELNVNKEITSILCLGDSFTIGIGAQAGNSYPSYLQELINGISSEKEINVINHGQPGLNSYEAYTILSEILQKNQIDLIILLVGVNNWSNYSGYPYGKIRGKAERFLLKIRVFGLYKHLIQRIKLFKRKSKRISFSDNYTGENIEESVLHQKIKDSFNKEKYREAVELALKGIEEYGDSGFIHYLFNSYYQINDLDNAIYWGKRAVISDRADSLSMKRISMVYTELLKNNLTDNRYDKYLEYLNDAKSFFYSQIAFESSALSYYKVFVDYETRMHKIGKWLKKDLNTIYKLSEEYNTDILVLDYPREYGYEAINKIIRNAVETKPGYFSISKVMDELLKKNPKIKSEDVFIPDGHCTSVGYRLMAENIYKKIFKESYIWLHEKTL